MIINIQLKTPIFLLMKPRNLLFLLLPLLFHFSQAQVISIPNDYSTIQGGINAAQNGDTILVSAGTYTENIDFIGKNLVIGSLFLTTGDTSHISQTIIDGGQNGSVVTLDNSEGPSAVLTGFTIQNGSGTFITNQNFGGGIYIEGASPHLSYLYILNNNITTGRGGGVYANNSDLVMDHLTVKGNSAGLAGGLYLGNDFNTNLNANPKPTLLNSVVNGNTGTFRAGGVYCSYAIVTLQRVEITNNTSDNGGGFYLGNCKVILSHLTLESNTANTEGGIMYFDGSEAVIANSILWNNTPQNMYLYPDPAFSTVTIAYSNVQDTQSTVNSADGVLNWESGNIDADPLFFGMGDYYLQSGSPCIDSAAVLYVWQTDTVVNWAPSEYVGPAPDMGAYEERVFMNISDPSSPISGSLSLDAFPNPFQDLINFSYSLITDTRIEISLYNLQGKLIRNGATDLQSYGTHQGSMDVSDLPAGIYLLHLQTEDGLVDQKKILKAR